MNSTSNDTAEREKKSAAASSVVAAVVLTVLKVVVGILTGSLGMLSEAAHSGLDLVAALVTFFAVRLSDRPADELHHYGHGKVENLSALIETLLLLITCVWIVYEAVNRLFFHPVEVDVNLWSFGVMAVSIVVNMTRSRMLYRVARKHNSQALEADALHFSTDVWSSWVVVGGLALVWLGQHLGPKWAWLSKADPVAALGVALIVMFVTYELGKKTVAVLLDEAPFGLVERIASEASRVPGVAAAGPVRIRQAGPYSFVDLPVSMERSASLEEAHDVATAVERRVRALLPRGDVAVRVDPVRQAREPLAQSISAIAGRLGMRTHSVHAHEVRGRLFVDLHVEVPADIRLGQAHDRVTRLETAVRDELPAVRDIHTHIEPVAAMILPSDGIGPAIEERLRAQIAAIAEAAPGVRGTNRLHVRPDPGGYDVVVHALADPDLSVAEAHALANQLENRILAQVPGVTRVLVHLEPEGEEEALPSPQS